MTFRKQVLSIHHNTIRHYMNITGIIRRVWHRSKLSNQYVIFYSINVYFILTNDNPPRLFYVWKRGGIICCNDLLFVPCKAFNRYNVFTVWFIVISDKYKCDIQPPWNTAYFFKNPQTPEVTQRTLFSYCVYLNAYIFWNNSFKIRSVCTLLGDHTFFLPGGFFCTWSWFTMEQWVDE